MHLGAKLRNTCTLLNTCSLLALWLPGPCLIWTILELENIPYQKYWLWISGFRIMFFCLDPDSDFKFLWIRIRFLNFSGFGSSFQISLDPETDPVRGWIRIRFVLRGWIRIQSISDRNLGGYTLKLCLSLDTKQTYIINNICQRSTKCNCIDAKKQPVLRSFIDKNS